MDAYQLTATTMRALRLFTLVIAMGMMASWGSSLIHLFRYGPRTAPAVMADVTGEQERNRAMFAAFAAAIFLFQLGFLARLPGIVQLRVWMVGLLIVDGVLLWAIYHHGSRDERFNRQGTVTVHAVIFLLCAMLAVVTR